MAATSRLKWTLLPVVFLASLNAYGGGGDTDPSYNRGISLWQCKLCLRIERFVKAGKPYCWGPPGSPHPRSDTRKVPRRERLQETDHYRYFDSLSG